jgi:hypothetical protein
VIYFIKSTELSRMSPKTAGYAPTYVSPVKLRARAQAGLGEPQAEQLLAQRLFRTRSETAPTERRVQGVEDVTRGLGLASDYAIRIQNVVRDTNPSFSPKTQTQRIFQAQGRLAEILRALKIDSGARMEIARRASAWWKKHYETELERNRTVHFIRWDSRRT